MSRLLMCAAAAVMIFAASSFAQSVPTQAEKMAIAAVWNDIASATAKKDRKALEAIYAADFVHVHAKGIIDDRAGRLDAMLTGEPTIDTATQVDLAFRKYGETIIATGFVTINGDDGKPVKYAVTRVYVKEKGRWVFASSQASPVSE